MRRRGREIQSEKRRREVERGKERTREMSERKEESSHLISFNRYLCSCQSDQNIFCYENSSTTLHYLQRRLIVTPTVIIDDPIYFQRSYFTSRVTGKSAVPLTSSYERLLVLWRSREKLTILVWSVSLWCVSLCFVFLAGWLTNVLTDWLTDWLTLWLTEWLTDWLTDWSTD